MKKPSVLPKGLQILLAVAAFVIVVAGMRAAQAVIVPFLLTAFIAVISAPLLVWMQRKEVPAPVAILLVVIGVAVGGLLLIGLVGASVNDFSKNLDTYTARLSDEFGGAWTWLERTTGFAEPMEPDEAQTEGAATSEERPGADPGDAEGMARGWRKRVSSRNPAQEGWTSREVCCPPT